MEKHCIVEDNILTFQEFLRFVTMLTSALASTSGLSRAQRRPRMMGRLRRAPVVIFKMVPWVNLINMADKTNTKIDAITNVIKMILVCMTVIPHIMKARIMTAIVIRTHTVTMTKHTQRARTKAETTTRVVTKCTTLMLWTIGSHHVHAALTTSIGQEDPGKIPLSVIFP